MKFTNELRGVKSRLLLFSVLLLIPVMMFAQSITVKGTVLDSAGEAVIGASVVEKGNPSNGTITDFDGKFTLAVSKGKRIVISFVGYETQEVDAVTGKELTITLQDDSQALEEVVVLGYSSILCRSAAESGVFADGTGQKPEAHSGFHVGLGRRLQKAARIGRRMKWLTLKTACDAILTQF